MIKKITAIVRESQIETIVSALNEINLGGLSLSHVKGFGEYHNEFSPDGLVEHVKLEIWLDEIGVPQVVSVIMKHAHTGLQGDGVVAVENVAEFYRIRTRKRLP